LVDEWVSAIGLRQEDYGPHSLRRTKASIIYRATSNLRAVQILLGHTKIENTVRYLGVDVEDAPALAEGTAGGLSGTPGAVIASCWPLGPAFTLPESRPCLRRR
jgi:Phage integrase family